MEDWHKCYNSLRGDEALIYNWGAEAKIKKSAQLGRNSNDERAEEEEDESERSNSEAAAVPTDVVGIVKSWSQIGDAVMVKNGDEEKLQRFYIAKICGFYDERESDDKEGYICMSVCMCVICMYV